MNRNIEIPSTYNYIAVFLTFRCNLTCSYCINANSTIDRKRKLLTSEEWVKGLDRILSRPDLPITLGGGEPTLHPQFYSMVNELHDRGHKLDLLTNSMFGVHHFMHEISPKVFKRDAPYASIRFSYHPETMASEVLIWKTKKLLDAGYSVGIWSVNHPKYARENFKFAERCKDEGIDFRLKEFLGMHDGNMYGSYRYPNACNGVKKAPVQCKTSELIIGPDGNVYRCHADLYLQNEPIGHILDDDFQIEDIYRPCDIYGFCNPCDTKLKFDRFQKIGHCAVDIRKDE